MTGIAVNLGCATCPFWPRGTPGAVNVDIMATGHEDVRADVTALPFRAASLGAIFAHHLLEHLQRPQARPAVAQWHRLLRPGGVLSIIVPDWQHLFAGRDVASLEFRDRCLFGLDSPPGPRERHQSAWNEREVIALLWETGFVAVEPVRIATYTPLVARPAWQSGARGWKAAA